MDMLIGCGILVGWVAIFAAVLKLVGPPDDARPHRRMKGGGGAGGSCCH